MWPLQGADCSAWSLREVVDTIKKSTRPLSLEFRGGAKSPLSITPPEDDDEEEQIGAGVGLEPRDKLSRVRSSGSDDLYSPSGGARGGGLKVLAKAGGTAPPLGEYKLLENCKCYQGPELDAAA